MRRFALMILCLILLGLPGAAAAGPRYAALTFDDGPSGRFTRQLLEGLEERDVKATFLLCGYRMKEDPRMAGDIFAAGHEIGIHGYSHRSMAKMCRRDIARELADTAALLPAGCVPAFMRPPGGATTQAVRDAARDAGLGVLNWSVDPRDWATHDAAAVERTVIDAVGDGDIILLHDMCASSVEAALVIVDALQARGYRFVTVSELARLRGTSIQPGRVYARFR